MPRQKRKAQTFDQSGTGDDMKLATLALLGLAALAPLAAAQAPAFPSRAVTIIVPFTAGSGSDTSARFFGEQLSRILHQPFIVENRPGASGVIAVNVVKNAPADGHTMLLASNSPIAVNPVTIKDLPYDPVKDLKPISGVTRGMNALVVAPESGIRSVADLVAQSKDRKLSVGTYSDGYRLALEWLSSLTGARFMNVPYKGGAPVFTDVMGGHLDAGIVDMGGAATIIKTGKLRAIAVSGESRHPEFPDVPTVRESGYPDYVNYSWTSFYVRSATPDSATKTLADAMQQALHSDAAKEFVRKTGGELMPYTADGMREYQKVEIARFRSIAESAGIQPQ
jgi:tripartite-type tricarboxylate transporter receptor subunit TctC